MLLSGRTLAAVLAVIILFSFLPVSAGPVSEDVDFGVGLIKQKFYWLGVEVLKAVDGKMESDAQRVRAFTALRDAHGILARRRRINDTAEEERKYREKHTKLASEYSRRVRALQGGGTEKGGLDAWIRVRQQAMAKAREYVAARDPARKKALLQDMIALYDRAVRGMQSELKKADAALRKMAQKEPDFGSIPYKRWEKKYGDLQYPHMSAGVELGRTRYEYYRSLPSTSEFKAKRKLLLGEVIEGLEGVTSEYDRHAYAIVGFYTLGQAYNDAGKYAEARQACAPGMSLIKEFISQDRSGRIRKQMTPWYAKILATWGIASAKLGKYSEAIPKLKAVKHPEVELALGEVYLMQMVKLGAAKNTAGAAKARAAAEAVLNPLMKVSDFYRGKVRQLYRRYGLSGSGYFAALGRLETAVRQRDNQGVITWGQKVISYEADCTPAKRAQTIMAMGLAYWQEKMYPEAIVIYKHLAASEPDDDKARKYAQYAVGCFLKLYAKTKSPVDKILLAEAKIWMRDTYGGPGVEYSRGGDLKKAGKFLAAVKEFQKVKAGSLYYESAQEQMGECYVLAAKPLAGKNPAESKRLLAKGKQTLESFIKLVSRRSPFPKVRERRKRLRAAAVYRLADVDMWKGQEDYKACVARTADYEKLHAETEQLFPYVAWLRTRALVGVGELLKAELELQKMKKLAATIENQDRAKGMVTYLQDLVFSAYVNNSSAARKDMAGLEAKLKAAKSGTEKRDLTAKIEERNAAASEMARKALTIFLESLDGKASQPYDKLVWSIHELNRQNMMNEMVQVIDVYLKQYEAKPRLTAEQRKDVASVKLMLGIAYQRNGEYDKAYAVLKARFKVLDKQFKASKAAKPDSEYWTVLLYLGRTAKALGEKNEKYAKEAILIFLRLRKVLPRNSDDWWDVTAGVAEVRNAMGQYSQNLVAVGRFIITRPKLGGPQIRVRYVRVLEDIYRWARKKEDKSQALSLMIDVQAAELSELARKKQYADMVRVIRDFKLVAIDYGGSKNRARFRKVAEYIKANASKADIKKQAGQLVKNLTD
jgi:tetratricopeptide (TPR) repeat protein